MVMTSCLDKNSDCREKDRKQGKKSHREIRNISEEFGIIDLSKLSAGRGWGPFMVTSQISEFSAIQFHLWAIRGSHDGYRLGTLYYTMISLC